MVYGDNVSHERWILFVLVVYYLLEQEHYV
jgi:hypothetical protein